jgi:hypothetical protein
VLTTAQRADDDAAARLQFDGRRQTLDCMERYRSRAGSSSIKFPLYDLPLEIELINAVGVSRFLVRLLDRRSHREGEPTSSHIRGN